jgi:hypothetical protein
MISGGSLKQMVNKLKTMKRQLSSTQSLASMSGRRASAE